MKKAVIWMIAAMMLMGSLKVFAADVTAGKLDAVAQDSLENDIQADITEGKIQAAMADELIIKIKQHIADTDELIDLLAAYENTDQLNGGISQTVTVTQMRLADIGSNVKELQMLEAESAVALKELRTAVHIFLSK